MSTKFFNRKFWIGFVLGAILCLSVIGTMLKIQEDKENLYRYSDLPPSNTIRHYEKIGECHYTFDIDTITNEVKSIRYFVPGGDKETWERKNSATGRDD